MSDRITAAEACERQAGCLFHRAELIVELSAAAEVVAAEFEHDDDNDMNELSELAADLVKVCGLVTFPTEGTAL